jgi:hypothetical protein
MRLRRRWQQWITRQQGNWSEFRLRVARERRDREAERRRMESEQQATTQTTAKAMLQQLDVAYVQALRDEIRASLVEEAQAEALAQARQELSTEAEKTRERLEDRYAQMVASWEEEIERRVEDGIARGTRDLKDELEEAITDLKAERQEARTRAQQAEGQLTALITQLLPPDKKIYLFSTGIRELALAGLNAVLGRSGLVIKSRETFSERQVKCQLGPSRWAQRSLFWVDKATPAGVVDEDPESEADVSNNVNTPEPLALPAGERPA